MHVHREAGWKVLGGRVEHDHDFDRPGHFHPSERGTGGVFYFERETEEQTLGDRSWAAALPSYLVRDGAGSIVGRVAAHPAYWERKSPGARYVHARGKKKRPEWEFRVWGTTGRGVAESDRGFGTRLEAARRMLREIEEVGR